MLPNRIRLSQKATSKLQYIKNNTGLTPNILSRIAIMLAIKEGGGLANAGVSDYEGQELDKSILFGEYTDVYDVMINQYIFDNNLDLPIKQIVTALVEIGVHKMGHIKQLSDVHKLK